MNQEKILLNGEEYVHIRTYNGALNMLDLMADTVKQLEKRVKRLEEANKASALWIDHLKKLLTKTKKRGKVLHGKREKDNI